MKKKYYIISTIIIFGLGFLLHNIYDMLPNFLTSIFFSVNDSLWEHNKLILTSYLVLSIIAKVFYRGNIRNIFFASLISSIVCMVLETTIFGFIYFFILNIKDNMIVALTTYLVSILISQVLWVILLDREYSNKIDTYGIIGFVLIYMLFTFLTYYTPKYKIFYDYKNYNFGIKK